LGEGGLEGEIRYIEKWFILAALIGLVSGLGAVAFTLLTRWVEAVLLEGVAGYVAPKPGAGAGGHVIPEERLLLALVPIIGGLVSGLLVFKLAPEAEGHGTDAVIHAYHYKDGAMRRRVPLVKMLASAFTIGSGGSAGKEGPVAQIGGGFGSLLADVFRLSPRDRRIAVAAGLGSGIGAMFKAPIGGAVFASEVLYVADYETSIIPPTFMASFVSYIVVGFLHGWEPIFWSPSFSGREYSLYSFTTMAVFALLGLVNGLLGRVYVKTFYWVRDYFKYRLAVSPVLKPVLGAAATGAMGAFFPHVLGSGYGWLQYMIKENLVFLPLHVLLLLPLLKILATSFSVGSGGSGGVFAPSLTIGGTVGVLHWLAIRSLVPGYDVPAAGFIIVGMMSFFAGVGKVPLATMLMISEMTGNYQLLPPALMSITLSYVLTGELTIYESQVYNREESPAHGGRKIGHVRLLYDKLVERRPSLLDEVKARDVMRRARAKLLCSEPGFRAVKLAKMYHHRVLPVVDSSNRFAGFLAVDDVLLGGERSMGVEVCLLHLMKGVEVGPSAPLRDVLESMLEHEFDKVAVVDGDGVLLGIVAYKDVVEYLMERGTPL